MKLPPTETEWLAAEAARKKIMERYVNANPETAHRYAGLSVLDILWQEIDDYMDELMEQGAPERSALVSELGSQYTRAQAAELADEWYAALSQWGEQRGRCQGLAFAIAIITNPYAADVPAVKKEALQRWESRH